MDQWAVQWYERRRERGRQMHEESARRHRIECIARGARLREYPEWDIDADMCMAAVKRNGLALRDVPRRLVSPEICEAAVKQNGMALKHVPKDMRSKRICAAALEQSPEAAAFVPGGMKNAPEPPAGAPKEEEDAHPAP